MDAKEQTYAKYVYDNLPGIVAAFYEQLWELMVREHVERVRVKDEKIAELEKQMGELEGRLESLENWRSRRRLGTAYGCEE